MKRTFTVGIRIVALAMLIVACAPAQPDPAADRPDDGGKAELAHAQCMREHGVDWPDPELIDGEWQVRLDQDIDLESPTYKAAESACAPTRQDADADAAGGDVDAAERKRQEQEMDRMLKFAACMRDEGIEFPDPVMDDNGDISGPAGPVDGDWDAFEVAKQACEDRTGASMP